MSHVTIDVEQLRTDLAANIAAGVPTCELRKLLAELELLELELLELVELLELEPVGL